MAFSRRFLAALGIEADKVEEIINAHVEVVDALKEARDEFKKDSIELEKVKKELAQTQKALKEKGDGETVSKEEHDALKKEYTDFKADVERRETKAAKEKAVRAYFESKNIVGKNLDIAIRGSRSEIDAIELDGEKIKDTTTLDTLIGGDFSGLVSTTKITGASVSKPVSNNGGKDLTKDDIYKKDDKGRYVMSASERQKALADNPDLLN